MTIQKRGNTPSSAARGKLICLAAALAFLVVPPVSAENPGSSPASLSDFEKEQFLRSAEVIQSKRIGIGVTGSLRATLSDGKITHDAHIQTVNVRKRKHESAAGVEYAFRDSYKFNIAAYKLDRLIGLDMVPVSVERKFKGTPAAFTWWVDDVMMMEKDRYQKKIAPPKEQTTKWAHQLYALRVFHQLVANSDPNLGNMLITNNWDVRLIDFTRGFRRPKKPRAPKNITRCPRAIHQALGNLSHETVTAELGSYLEKAEIEGLVGRCKRIREILDRKISASSEAAILFDSL